MGRDAPTADSNSAHSNLPTHLHFTSSLQLSLCHCSLLKRSQSYTLFLPTKTSVQTSSGGKKKVLYRERKNKSLSSCTGGRSRISYTCSLLSEHPPPLSQRAAGKHGQLWSQRNTQNTPSGTWQAGNMGQEAKRWRWEEVGVIGVE